MPKNTTAVALNTILIYLTPNITVFLIIITVFAQNIIIYFFLKKLHTPVFSLDTTVFALNTIICPKYRCICDHIPLYVKLFVVACILAQSIILPSGLGTCHIGLVLRIFARWKNRLNVLNVFAVYSVWHLKSASKSIWLI